MASSFTITSFLVSFFLSILFTSTIVKGDLVSDICAKTPNATLCETLLRSDPHSKTADLETLGAITFNMTSKLIDSTSALVTSLRDNATNATLKEVYSKCIDQYAFVELSRENAEGYFKDKKCGQVVHFMSRSIGDLLTCDSSFFEHSVVEDEKLQQASFSLEQYCSAIIVMAVRL
ncbi:pectinesterase inhibitor-like [Nicotiana tabacum]|uniref:Pectinesterase inhibitor-like n=1 Tax=Nicotiana tabacum TaxID=4097 RepID=A0A1S4BUE7_TOBAC|nr:PREDICTED: pectinesterase inhibitor-like [Nicotiana tabacum]